MLQELPLEAEYPGASAASAVSVHTLNSALKDVVEGAFLPIWVRGEISDFKRHRNGHWYFTLRDKNAQMRCVVWSRDQRRVPAVPEDGMTVAAHGRLTVYANKGEVQFTAHALEAEGDGLWRKAMLETRARLEAEGLLAPDRKRPLPRYPRCIAVITSPDGAAMHDILHVCRKRYPQVNIVVVPARVQGEGAARQLRQALELTARWGQADVVIIGRGGGAREDLWCFNDEALARSIARCPIPTISAVGHEIDITICDLVADYRAATPSAAAEAAVPSVDELAARLRGQSSRVARALRQMVRRRAEIVSRARRTLPAAMSARLAHSRASVRLLASRINDLSPLAVLARGYSVAIDPAGRTLSSSRDFTVADHFQLVVRDGRITARVESTEASQEEKTVVI